MYPPGQFHLDPNRTLDIILECFECNLNKESFFLPLLKSYMGKSGTAALFQILGFKFQFYKVCFLCKVYMVTKLEGLYGQGSNEG